MKRVQETQERCGAPLVGDKHQHLVCDYAPVITCSRLSYLIPLSPRCHYKTVFHLSPIFCSSVVARGIVLREKGVLNDIGVSGFKDHAPSIHRVKK